MIEIKDRHRSENCWEFLITKEQRPHKCQLTTEHFNKMVFITLLEICICMAVTLIPQCI
jgi:hypothetical protein